LGHDANTELSGVMEVREVYSIGEPVRPLAIQQCPCGGVILTQLVVKRCSPSPAVLKYHPASARQPGLCGDFW